jgi:hypothetical protein
MVRLAKECATQTGAGLADDAVSANVRDFVLTHVNPHGRTGVD